MKSVVTKATFKPKGYPYLGIQKTPSSGGCAIPGTVVLFYAPESGIVVQAVNGTCVNRIGTVSDNWAEAECFVPLDGQVVLSND